MAGRAANLATRDGNSWHACLAEIGCASNKLCTQLPPLMISEEPSIC
jgi:hypothetical protein